MLSRTGKRLSLNQMVLLRHLKAEFKKRSQCFRPLSFTRMLYQQPSIYAARRRRIHEKKILSSLSSKEGVVKAFNTALFLLALLMAIMAGLPLLGLDLVLIGKGELVEVSIDDSNLHLFMVRSAAFATFASFTLNYFRRRRPLSSVAPLMYFCVWASIFAPHT
jgi:hypothetical protein